MSESYMDWWAGRTWYEVHGGEEADQALVTCTAAPDTRTFTSEASVS